MNRRILGVVLGAMALAAGLSLVAREVNAAPEPSRIPVSWELNFRYGPLNRITVSIDGKQSTYWYMRYTVINNTGRDVLFTPSFEIVADTGTAQAAFKEGNGKDNIPNAVYEKIKEQEANPLLQSPNSVFGRLLQGEDNAKDSVIIFPALDPEGRDFRLYAMGLSGETAEVINPITGKSVILQKTLQMDLKLPGQAIGIDPKVQVTGIRWVMK
jgi:hypothetical protein